MKNPKDRLCEAIKNGEVLTVIHHSKNPPGAVRDIMPIRITGNTVKAHCLTSSALRTFTIDTLSIIDDKGRIESNGVRAPGTLIPPRYASIQDFLQKENDFLTRLGWRIKNNGKSALLYHCFKNGKQRENPSVWMIYEQYATDFYLDENMKLHYKLRLKKEPWTVFSEGQNVRHYSSLDKAATRFLECAWRLQSAGKREGGE